MTTRGHLRVWGERDETQALWSVKAELQSSAGAECKRRAVHAAGELHISEETQ